MGIDAIFEVERAAVKTKSAPRRRPQSRRAALAISLVGTGVALVVLALVGASSAVAQSTPEEQCASLKSNPSAYQQCVETVRKAQSLTASPTPTASSQATPAPGASAAEASRAEQRRQMTIAIIGALIFAALIIGFSIWRTLRRSGKYPVAEITTLMGTMIPPEVRERDPNAAAIPIPARGGKTAGKLMALSFVVAALVIVGGVAIVATGNTEKIWILPIVLLPFGVAYAWWVTRKAVKSSDEWLAPLGLAVTKTPSAIVGPNPAGMAGGNVLRPYVVGPSVMEGRRFGREVTITQESTGFGGISIRILVKGRAPAASCKGEAGEWSGSLPAGAAGDLIRSSGTGPGTVTIAGDGQGLVLIRQVSQRELLSSEGYGLMVRDLGFIESVMDAEGR